MGELGTAFSFQSVQIVEGAPGHATAQVLPQPFRRIEFWAVGRQKDEGDVGGELQPRVVWTALLSSKITLKVVG